MIAATRVVDRRMLDGAHLPAGGRPGLVLRGRPERVGGCHRYGISFLILHGGCSLRAPPRSSARSSALSAMRSRRQQRRQPREANENRTRLSVQGKRASPRGHALSRRTVASPSRSIRQPCRASLPATARQWSTSVRDAHLWAQIEEPPNGSFSSQRFALAQIPRLSSVF